MGKTRKLRGWGKKTSADILKTVFMSVPVCAGERFNVLNFEQWVSIKRANVMAVAPL